MPESEMTPQPDSPRPEQVGYHQSDNDIELPPIRKSSGDGTPISQSRGSRYRKPGSLLRLIGSAILAGTLVGVSLFLFQGLSAEKQHPNWQHVAAAAEASNEYSHLVQLDTSGSSKVVTEIELTSADANRAASTQIREALVRGDLAGATTALQAAQQIPNTPGGEVEQPELVAGSELATALKDQRKELYQVELFDCCDEDGDIVQVLVNDVPFATVPIMHGGTLLSIPLSQGHNTVTVQAVHDGGGGVTLAFKTSRGQFFAGFMMVGQSYQLGVTVQ